MNDVLLFFHLIGLVVAMGPGFANGIIVTRAASATPEAAQALRALPPILSRVSAVGLALLIVTGPILLFTKYNWHAPEPVSFGIKMGLVLAIIGLFGWMQVIIAQVRKTGNAALAGRLQLLGPLMSILAVLTVIFAVAAFH
ncbi:MAG: hypothetical protein U1E56_02090 [Bauldia sp.]